MRESIPMDDPAMVERGMSWADEESSGLMDGVRRKTPALVDRRPGACVLAAILGGVLLGCLRKQWKW